MKKIVLGTIFLLSCIVSAEAQTLYGTTLFGGKGGGGTINRFVLKTNELTVVKSFENVAGITFRLIQASNGRFYGMAGGGSSAMGVIFSFDPQTKTYTKLWDFDGINGTSPEGYLLQATDGKLYGMTQYGGINNQGVIFSFDLSSFTYKKLIDFDGINGGYPIGSLIQARDGKLYGLTHGGGTSRDGVIFSFDPSSSVFVKLKDFTGADGANPYVSLLQAADGKLYGTTHSGGSNGIGVVFSFDPSSSTYVKIHDFDHINGRWPGIDRKSLVQASNGNLYGRTDRGGKNEMGVLFSINPSSMKFTNEKDFSTTNPGNTFTLTNDGKLVGVADSILFSFDPLTSEYLILKNFGNKNNSPAGPMLQAKDGKLYGTKSSAGFFHRGVIFSFDLSDYSYNILYESGRNRDGYQVTGSLVRTNTGKLYGMTTAGGSMGYGTIFSFDPATSTYAKLKDFDHMNGANPRGGLMQANDGKLYGMTETGGTNNKGVIFSFDPASSRYIKLKDFTGPYDASPVGSLIQANDGKLYGLTRGGAIFSFDPTSSTYSKLKTFEEPCQDCDIGNSPYGDLLQASNGIMYGMTSAGGFGSGGTVFSFDPSTLIHDNFIDFTNFTFPYGSLIQAKDGFLYGMTSEGGGAGYGEIFRLRLASNPGGPISFESAVSLFPSIDGAFPLGTLMQATNGKLYGTTSRGGASNKGVIFSFDISSSSYVKLQDFNGLNGDYPGIGSRFIEVSVAEANTAPVLAAIGNKSINELEDFRFTTKATDKDSPASKLKFSIANAATGKFPEGATIDRSSGLFCWIPTEAQGPGTYRVKIVVSDGECTDEEEIEITVCEVNSKPVLSTIGDQTVDEDRLLTFPVKAVDMDIPENTLTYSLADPAAGVFPTGASIDTSTGAFSWRPAKNQVPETFRVRVIVSDGTAKDEEEFAINVRKTSPASLIAYPNPSAHRATVRFAVPAAEAMVTLVLYDHKGMQINRLYEGRAEASIPYSFDLNASDLSPGIYLIKLSMARKTETFKMIITE